MSDFGCQVGAVIFQNKSRGKLFVKGASFRHQRAFLTEQVLQSLLLIYLHLFNYFKNRAIEDDDLMLFDLMIALRSTETQNITLKSLALFRPKLRNSSSTYQIARFVNYYCCGVNVIEFWIRLKN